MSHGVYEPVMACYSAATGSRVETRRVTAPEVHKFFKAVEYLLRNVEVEPDDPFWSATFRELKRARFEIAAYPVPPAVVLKTLEEGVSSKLDRAALSFPEYGQVVEGVRASIRDGTTTVGNPLLDGIRELAREAPGGAVCVCETRLIRPTERLLASSGLDLEVITAAQLRNTGTFAWIAAVGPMRWYPPFVFAAPRAHAIISVSYSWLSARPRQLPSFDRRAVLSRRVDEEHLPAPPPSDAEIESVVEALLPDSGLVKSKGFLSRLGDDSAHEQASAIQVLVDGEAVVLLDAEEGASTIVIDLAEVGKRRVHRQLVKDLEPGTFLLVREGGGGDYILPLADQLLGPRAEACRSRQSKWKSKLRAMIRQTSYAAVARELTRAGAVRASETNLRRWVWERSIKPNDFADFAAIMAVIDLPDDAEAYWKTMKLIDRAHMQAGQVVRRRLLDKVHRTDLSKLERLGRASFSLGESSGNLLACRIQEVSTTPVKVPVSRIGHVIDTAVMKWLD